MTVELQKELIKFVFQGYRDARVILPIVEPSMFDMPEHQLCMEILKAYLKEMKVFPKKPNLMDFAIRELEKQEVAPEVTKEVKRALREAYLPLEAEPVGLKKTLIKFVQFRMAKDLIGGYSDRLGEGMGIFDEIRTGMAKVIRIEDLYNGYKTDNGFLLQDYKPTDLANYADGQPTYLHALNKMMGRGGLMAPEVVVILAAPKAFKTGLLINLITPYIRNGKKIFYADCENGAKAIKIRHYQCMMGMTVKEIVMPESKEILKKMITHYKVAGGDLYVAEYAMNRDTMDSVDADLEYLRDEFGWEPDGIAVDFSDRFRPTDTSLLRKAGWEQVSGVFSDIHNLNRKWNTWTITPGLVNRAAVDKKVFSQKDVGADFGKLGSVHAMFALCQTKEEKKAKIARLLPVVQRMGVEFTGTEMCYLKMEKSKMTVTELTEEEALEIMEEQEGFVED